MNIAFFDLDGTLIDGDSHQLVVKHIQFAANGRRVFDSFIPFRFFGIFFYNLYIANAYRGIDHTNYRRIAEAVRTQAYRLVLRRLRPGAISAISEWRKRGFALCLITAADKCVADAVSQYLGFDFVISNSAHFDKSRTEPAVFGLGKYVHARKLCEERLTTLADCVFFSDSYDDLPLLLAVKEGWVVNPSGIMKVLTRFLGLRNTYWA